ncbi:CpaF family protein [Streptomyces sp. SM12]|uniref:CpaF family protein n=1 Tax=Streptomyces sp. SM12 TaxID=1071602 RepID=UPI000CD55568|nr:CpaF/VirB11 family protein [Streptomyces sp. SM12]
METRRRELPQPVSAVDEQRLASEVIRLIVAQWSTRAAADPESPGVDRATETTVRQLVFDELYRAGALQPHLDNMDVEEIVIDGPDNVTLHYFDKPPRRVAPLADSNEALRLMLNRLLQRSNAGDRGLTDARPNGHGELGDHRIAATLMTRRPTAVIRRHRLRGHTLDDLVRWHTIDPLLAQFLRACVQARQTLLIAGDMGAGKTTLLRALALAIPEHERLVTLEDVRELGLDELEGGPHTLAMQSRESGGERTSDGRLLGEISIADAFAHTLRLGAQRVIVGEVRSAEVVPMLDAMSGGGSGSMCTLHARRAEEVMERLMLLILRSGIPEAAAARMISTSIDFVVYLRRTAVQGPDGLVQWRYVSDVLETAGAGENGRHPSMNTIFAPGRDGRAVYQNQAPMRMTELTKVSPNLMQWLQGGSRWGMS